MTRKDYDLLAACIGATLAYNLENTERVMYYFQTCLKNELRIDNPRFDEAKFDKRVEYWTDEHRN